MEKNTVLDAGVFVEGRFMKGATTPGVADEVDVPPTVDVLAPGREAMGGARKAAEKSGDLDVLSRADLEVLALALEKGWKVATSDFAVQNVAGELGLEVVPVGKAIRKRIEWVWYCPACGRKADRKGVCEVCGTELKRKPARFKKSRL